MNFTLTIILIGFALIFIMANLAVLNAFYIERKKISDAWNKIIDAFSLRTDLVPLLISTFQDYKKLDDKSLELIIAYKNNCYKERDKNKKIGLERKLDTYIDQIISEAKKTPKLKSDIDFFEIQSLLKIRRAEIINAINEYNEAIKIYNNRLKSWTSKIISFLFSFQKIHTI